MANDNQSGPVQFSWVATLLASSLAAMLGFFLSDLKADKSSFLTIREHEEFNKNITNQIIALEKEVAGLKVDISSNTLKIQQLPTRDDINEWIHRSFPGTGSVTDGDSRKRK